MNRTQGWYAHGAKTCFRVVTVLIACLFCALILTPADIASAAEGAATGVTDTSAATGTAVSAVDNTAALVPCTDDYTTFATEVVADYSWYNTQKTSFTFTNEGTGKNVINKLYGLANIVNGTATGISADSFQGKTITIGGGIAVNLLGNEWTPIGTVDHPFDGTFDGGSTGGVIIRNFIVSTIYANAGFFGVTGSHSTLHNVTIEAGNSGKIELGTQTVPYTAGAIQCVGTLVGRAEGAITNCTSAMGISIVCNTTVTDTLEVIVDGVGGLAGRCRGNLSNSGYTGTVNIYSASNTTSTRDQGYIMMTCIGGVVGFFGDIDAPATTTHAITNCTNSGEVIVNTGGYASGDRFGELVVSQAGYVGGVAGYSTGSVTSCTNSGDVDTSYRMKSAIYGTTIGAAGCYTGGIVGALRSDIFPAMATAIKGVDPSVSGVPKSAFDAGTGAAGNPVYISGCENTGTIFGNHSVGGIAGSIGWYATVTSCSNNVVYTYVDPTDTDYLIKARGIKAARWNKPSVGGIVGKCYGNISYCYNRSRVWSTTDAGYYVAGIVGTIYKGTSIEGYAAPTPEVWACYNTGYAQSSLRSASIAGQNEGYIHDCYSLPNTSFSDTLVSNDYATTARVDWMESAKLKSSSGVSALNNLAASEAWKEYFVVASSDTENDGYPVLSWQADASAAKADLSDSSAQVTISLQKDADYNGAAAIPTLKVVYNGVELVQNADYRVVVSPNAKDKTLASDRTTGTRPYTATITGIGKYSGTPNVSVNYGIVVGDLSTCTFAITEHDYTGSAVTLSASDVKVIGVTGNVVPSSDYTLIVNDGKDCITRGSYSVVATAVQSDAANYVGTLTNAAGFVISPADLYSDCTITGVSANGQTYATDQLSSMTFTYTGSPIYPTVDGITYNGLTLKEGATASTYGSDYCVTYMSDSDCYTNVTPTDATTNKTPNMNIQSVWSSTVGNYHNYVDLYYRIVAADIGTADIAVPDQAYDNGAARGQTIITFNGQTLVENADYTVTYANNTQVGTATATITGMGNFTGTVKKTFQITNETPVAITSCTVSSIAAQGWTGQAVTPEVTVTAPGGTVLRQNYDYVLTYTDNVDANNTTSSVATVTITGCGKYVGTASTTFKIVAHTLDFADGFNKLTYKDASESDATLAYNPVQLDGTVVSFASTSDYTGFTRGLGATVTVYVKRSTASATNYNISGLTVVGKASGTTYAIGSMALSNEIDSSGTNRGTFTFTMPDEDVIVKSVDTTVATTPMFECTVDAIASAQYTGSAIKPEPVVRASNGTVLTRDVDYRVFSYKNNTDVGTATVTVVGTGNHYGKLDATFSITPLGTMTVSADDVTATYDGKGQGIIAKASRPEATVRYGTSADSCTLTESPTFTDVARDENGAVVGHTVYFVATAPGYRATGSATVTVEPRAATVSADDSGKEVGGTDPVLTATVGNVLPADRLVYTISRPGKGTDEAVGTYKDAIVVSGDAVQKNYTVTYTLGDFVISQVGALKVSAYNVDVPYDGQAHGVEPSTTVAGATILYADSTGAYTLTECPTFTNVARDADGKVVTHTVNFKATKSGYTDSYGSATVTIEPATVTVTADAAWKYTGKADPTFSASVAGLIGSDTVSYTVVRPTVGTQESAGVYAGAIRVSGKVVQGNYAVTYVAGDFTIKDAWKRLAGTSRYLTMKSIVDEGFADGSCSTVVLATGQNFPDALSASGLAGLYGAPIVLTDGAAANLSATARAEIVRLGATHVVVVGGEGSVSAGAYADVSAIPGVTAERVAGGTRVDTALKVYAAGRDVVHEDAQGNKVTGWGDSVIIATPNGFADALSVSPYSWSTATPIILTGSDGNLTDDAKTLLASAKAGGLTKAIVVGGVNSVSAESESWLVGVLGSDNVTRLAGASRYATSEEIAVFSAANGLSYAHPAVTTGQKFPDALAGAALCGKMRSVLLLVDDSNTTCISDLNANTKAIDYGYILGGTSTVTPATVALLPTP